MDSTGAAVLAVMATVTIAGIWYWNERIRKIPLAEFGIERVQRVLRWEPDEVREAISQRGWMTSYEWTLINQRQQAAIEAEIARRGLDSTDQHPK